VKIVRFKEKKGRKYWGAIENNKILKINKSPYKKIVKDKRKYYNLDEIEILPPSTPTKIIGLGLCFKDSYPSGEYPDEPIIFLKGTNALIGHNQKILYPNSIEFAWMEAELAIVIKKTCKSVSPKKAIDYILGYTIANDITAQNIRGLDHHLARSKSCDTFCPVGPHLETNLDTSDIDFSSWLNGKKIQHANTKDRIFTDSEILSIVSDLITLYPGDIILTGTHPGFPPGNIMEKGIIKKGDKIKIKFEGIGTLKNEVVSDNYKREEKI